MDEQQIEKSCKNCKFYVEHYIKRRYELSSIGGHCANEQLNSRRSKNRGKLFENCGYWQPDDEAKAARYLSIEQCINKMRRHLEQIAVILKDDKKV